MSQLTEVVRAANELGLSYGYYVALTNASNVAMADPITQKQKKRRNHRYTDEQRFLLWQEGYTDEQIGQAVGVSRQCVQQWRDQLELPSTSKYHINPKKYRLTTLRDGTYVVIKSE